MVLMVACGGSGSETPPPIEPTAPAWSDRESDPAAAGQEPAKPIQREESEAPDVPPEDVE
jgi:hypothetical protein